jgi:uncharacterized protein with GYD domain
MPRYLGMFKYSAEGYQGLLKDKAAGRETATRQALESVGGKLVAMYWLVSGEYSGIGIWDFPDAASETALNALTASTGAFAKFKAIELLTSSEMDAALGKTMTFRAPGR